MLAILAQELIDTIIDFLHADETSLKACSLTCKSFLFAARYHIFGDVTLAAHNFSRLVNLLDEAPHISTLVRHLAIHAPAGVTPGSRRQSTDEEIHLAQNLSSVTSRLQGVQSLHLGDIDFDLLTFESIILTLSTTLPNVRHLNLCRLKFRSFMHTANFIAAFPLLRTLKWAWVSWDSHSDSDTVYKQSRRRSEALEVWIEDFKAGQSRCLIDWLLLQNPLPRVHTFYLRASKPPRVAPLV